MERRNFGRHRGRREESAKEKRNGIQNQTDGDGKGHQFRVRKTRKRTERHAIGGVEQRAPLYGRKQNKRHSER